MLEISKVIFRHFLIGILITALIFWLIDEFPKLYFIKRNINSWLITAFSIPIIILIMSRFFYRKFIVRKNINQFVASLAILIFWILIFCFKAIVMSILFSISKNELIVFESLISITIYQLWVYFGIGLIHSIFGGYFLFIDLKTL